MTMAPELIYLLKVNAGIALFYAFYKLFCCRDTFFQWRRIALLGFLVLSFLYPLLNIQNWVKEQPAISELADYYALLMMADSTATNATAATETAPALAVPDLMTLFTLVYFCGILLLSIRFILQLLSIFRLVLKSKEVTVDNVRIKSLSSPANPFSFAKWIFIYLPGLSKDERKEIITHEQTHVQQRHSIDVILSEIVNIICWMNPFMWLLKAEIRLNLEYLADHKVVESVTDTRQYQYHLLGLANQYKQTGLYNNFNLSHLKNRIMMMNKKRTRTTGRIKYALFAPLTLALLLVSNIETVARSAERLINPAEESVSPGTTNTAEPASMLTEGPVTFHVTIVNSEGKPQPNLNIQTKIGDELKNFKTDANGKAVIELDMTNLRSAYLIASVPNSSSKERKGFGLSPNVTEQTIVFDTKADIDTYIKAGKRVLVKLRIANSANEPLAGSQLTTSISKQKATADDKGIIEMKVGLGEDITISQKGYSNGTYEVWNTTHVKDMTTPGLYTLYKIGESPVYQVVEVMPEFPGGMKGCIDFIAKNVQYPSVAKQNGTQGKVIVQFIVEKDGSLSSPVVVRSISPELDQEAIRVIKSMPKWTPGTEKGEAVRCKYTVPVAFKLQ